MQVLSAAPVILFGVVKYQVWHVFFNVFFRQLDYCTCVDSLTLPFLPHFHWTSMGEGYQMECRKIETPSPGLAGATCDEEWLWTARTPGRDGWHSYGIPTHVCKKDLFRHRFHVVWVVLGFFATLGTGVWNVQLRLARALCLTHMLL